MDFIPFPIQIQDHQKVSVQIIEKIHHFFHQRMCYILSAGAWGVTTDTTKTKNVAFLQDSNKNRIFFDDKASLPC